MVTDKRGLKGSVVPIVAEDDIREMLKVLTEVLGHPPVERP